MRGLCLGPALALALALATPALATDWAVDTGKSSIGFAVEGTFFGSPGTAAGTFKTYTAAISFDPDALGEASARVEIELASLDPNYEDVGSQAGNKTWFDTKAHPTLLFVSTGFAPGEGGGYVASGDLTVKGVTKPVSFPFTLTIADGTAQMQASFTVNRLDFGVGKAPDRSSVAFVEEDVTVTLDISAQAL